VGCIVCEYMRPYVVVFENFCACGVCCESCHLWIGISNWISSINFELNEIFCTCGVQCESCHIWNRIATWNNWTNSELNQNFCACGVYCESCHVWIRISDWINLANIELNQNFCARGLYCESCHIWISHVTHDWGLHDYIASDQSCVTGLLHMWHDSNIEYFICDMTQICSSHEWVMSHMNASCHVWIGHVPYEWGMSHMKEWSHVWMSHFLYE